MAARLAVRTNASEEKKHSTGPDAAGVPLYAQYNFPTASYSLSIVRSSLWSLRYASKEEGVHCFFFSGKSRCYCYHCSSRRPETRVVTQLHDEGAAGATVSPPLSPNPSWTLDG